MSPLIRVRLLMGVFPYAIDRLIDAAFGSWSQGARRAAPLAATILAAGLAAAGLSLAHSEFSEYSAYLPWGVAALAAISLGFVLIAGRRKADARPSVVPSLVGLLVMVSVIPLIQSGAELILARTTASEFVDRRTGTDVSLLDLQGLALRVPLPANEGAIGQPRWFYALRNDPADPRIALVRSPLGLGALDDRTVTARVVEDPQRVDGAIRAFTAHGWLTGQEQPAERDRYLANVSGALGDVTNLGSLGDLRAVASGSLVRVSLRFRGEGVAVCEALGSVCDGAALANGDGGFLLVADDPSRPGHPVLVQTTYPATDAPMHAVGRQVRAEAELDSLLTFPWVSRLIGWGNVLSVAYLDQDPALPVDRFWLGPMVLLAIAALLLVGRRLGYPVFRLEDPMARDGELPRLTPRAVPVSVSGRLAQPRGGPLDVEGAPGELRAPEAAGQGAVLLIRAPRETLELQLPVRGGSLTSMERGDVQWLVRRQPALWIHWFGSDARLLFADQAALRDAEAILESFA